MNITINGLQLGEGTDFQLAAPLQGFESAPIRTSSEDYSGRDGGIITGQNYSGRHLSIPGFIADTCANHAIARRTLVASLPIREDVDVVIDTFDNKQYATTARVVDYKADITGPQATVFKIELFAGDPYLYDGATAHTVTVPRKLGGGAVLPWTLPVTFLPGTPPTTVTNLGSIVVYPVIQIVGTANNPVITNVTTGGKVEIGDVLGPADTLRIDLHNRTVTLNGSSILPLMTLDSSWWGLQLGVNKIQYETNDGSDTGVATVIWRSAFSGV